MAPNARAPLTIVTMKETLTHFQTLGASPPDWVIPYDLAAWRLLESPDWCVGTLVARTMHRPGQGVNDGKKLEPSRDNAQPESWHLRTELVSSISVFKGAQAPNWFWLASQSEEFQFV